MGQRANYIIKQNQQLTIHYTHWRANHIASDLFLGEKRFLEYLQQCELSNELINEPWIEGCVIVDLDNRELFFWAFEFSKDTSVINYYLQQLKNKWFEWKIQLLKNGMYDVEQLLGIDYISRQELVPLNIVTKEAILEDTVQDWITTLVIIKEGTSAFVTMTGSLETDEILSYGPDILPLIKTKPHYPLPKEGVNTEKCIVIDGDQKYVYVNEYSIGFKEATQEHWKGYELFICDYGYIELLQHIGLETTDLVLSEKEIKQRFSEIVDNHTDFDQNFSDNFQPRNTFVEKLKNRIGRLFR